MAEIGSVCTAAALRLALATGSVMSGTDPNGVCFHPQNTTVVCCTTIKPVHATISKTVPLRKREAKHAESGR